MFDKQQLLDDISHAEEKAKTLCGPCAEDHARLARYLKSLLHIQETQKSSSPLSSRLQVLIRDGEIPLSDSWGRLIDDIEKVEVELQEDKDIDERWRILALQFDGHRMQALGFLKQILNALPESEFTEAREFLKASPLSGEEVLQNRIGEMINKDAIESALRNLDKALVSCNRRNYCSKEFTDLINACRNLNMAKNGG